MKVYVLRGYRNGMPIDMVEIIGVFNSKEKVEVAEFLDINKKFDYFEVEEFDLQ